MKQLSLAVAWLCVVALGVGFVIPWAYLEVKSPDVLQKIEQKAEDVILFGGLAKGLSRVTATIKRGTETITGEIPALSDIPDNISGIEIPQLANSEQTRVLLALLEMFTGTNQGIEWKSYLVYAIPLIALISALLLTIALGGATVAFAVSGACALIGLSFWWKLATLNTDDLFIAITIGPGLWVSVWSYLVLSLSALIQAFCLRKAR